MSTTTKSGRSVKRPARLISVGFNFEWEQPMPTLPRPDPMNIANAQNSKFTCDVCGKICQRDRDLTDHRNSVHLGLKDFHCGVPGCQKSFPVIRSLKRHIKIVHENLQPHSCPDCASSFSTPAQLKVHKEGVHDGIRHACLHAGCLKTYSDPSNLNRHVKQKH